MVRLRHSDDGLAEAAEINVTPFIDVMLVLLIIFMVAAPLATVDVKVDLPKSTAAALPRPQNPIYLTIQADHSLALENERIAAAVLGPSLRRVSQGDRSRRIFLRADKTVDYDTLMQVMNRLQASGYFQVALVGVARGEPR